MLTILGIIVVLIVSTLIVFIGLALYLIMIDYMSSDEQVRKK